jgi:CheY-like chemotaxis protein
VVPRRIGLPNNLRALIVDDSRGACEIFLHMLKMLGIDCRAVSSGAAALAELASNEHYGLLIIDWKMPGMDGVELLGHPQPAPDLAAAVIMATAYDHDELLAALGKNAVGAILGKPVTPSSLFDSIMLALHRDSGQSSPPELPAVTLSAQFAGRRVLLVEDNEVNRELAEEMLGNIGLTVDTAENGQLAVAKVGQQRYDLVLMDCHMPVMDGYAATEAIRSNPAFSQLPIVAMTANALAGDRERCLAAGMNDHIPKPIDVAVLHAALARWLGLPVAASPTTGAAGADAAAAARPGLDTASALARLSGNRSMYNRLLLRFCDNQANAADKLGADLAAQDRDAMILRAHLARPGRQYRRHPARPPGRGHRKPPQDHPAADPTVLASRLADLRQCLAEVVAQAARFAHEMPLAAAPVMSALPADAVSELQRLLENDDALAVRHFEGIAGQLRQIFAAHAVDQLAHQIDRYDFDDARETLAQLILQRQHAD